MTTHVNAAATLANTLRATEDGRAHLDACRSAVLHPATRSFTDAIGQPYNGWNEGQLAAYGCIDRLVAEGAVHKVRIPVDAVPGRDRDREGNQRKLADGLPPAFTAELCEGTSHHGDALLSWAADLMMPWVDGNSLETEGPLTDWTHTAPLEIGHTDASRTFLHLLESGIIARWPYRSADLWVFFFPTRATYLQWRQSAAVS